MIDGKVPKMILFGVMAAVILFALMPMVGIANTVTMTADNEGASELRFNYGSGMQFTRSYRATFDEIQITGGSSNISVPVSDIMVYADSNCSIVCDNRTFYLIADGHLQPATELGQYCTVSNTSSGLKVTYNTTQTITMSKPIWYYLPAEDGAYAYFENGTEVNLREDTNVAVAGLYAGYGAYNDVAYTLVTDRTEESVSTASWTLPGASGSTSYTVPEYISSSIRYYDGVWEYAKNSDGQTVTITGYTGQGGSITVPSTVGGYPVLTVGNHDPVINANIVSLTISEGIKNINFKAFSPPEGYNYTGTLTLPSTLEYIGAQAFRLAHFSGTLVIPENVGYLSYNTFDECEFINLVVKSSTVPAYSTYATTSIREVLNLGDATYSTGSYGLVADSVMDDTIPAMGCIANTTYTYNAQRTGTIAILFWLLPLIFLIGIIIVVVRHTNRNRNEFE